MVPREFNCRPFPAAAWARLSKKAQPSPHSMGRERLGNIARRCLPQVQASKLAAMEFLPKTLQGVDPGQSTESLGCEQSGSECGIAGGLHAVAIEGHFGAVALEDVEDRMADDGEV